ncbi:bacteriophage T4 gp5 trimerisation domain-containing protein [Escherichia albertii]|uniref:bacteriophage T4 gp5 trimerisation domain-containing protein n=1 Tax=Escherichia albertii TaxID=208962 RepID=UPI003BFA7697
MHAQKNMDTEVLNDQTVTVRRDRTKSITRNETNMIDGYELTRIKIRQDVAVKGPVTFISGDNRTEQATGIYLIGAGDCIRLECGLSALELFASGAIRLAGETFNIAARGDSVITTQGKLGLNPSSPGEPATPPGKDYKKELTTLVSQLFPEKDKSS